MSWTTHKISASATKVPINETQSDFFYNFGGEKTPLLGLTMSKAHS